MASAPSARRTGRVQRAAVQIGGCPTTPAPGRETPRGQFLGCAHRGSRPVQAMKLSLSLDKAGGASASPNTRGLRIWSSGIGSKMTLAKSIASVGISTSRPALRAKSQAWMKRSNAGKLKPSATERRPPGESTISLRSVLATALRAGATSALHQECGSPSTAAPGGSVGDHSGCPPDSRSVPNRTAVPTWPRTSKAVHSEHGEGLLQSRS